LEGEGVKESEPNSRREGKKLDVEAGWAKGREEVSSGDRERSRDGRSRERRSEGRSRGARTWHDGAEVSCQESSRPADGNQGCRSRSGAAGLYTQRAGVQAEDRQQEEGEGGGGPGGGGGGGGGRGNERAPHQTLEILYLNAQSLLGKINELRATAADLEPDIILITETWCNQDVNNAFLSLPGYEVQIDLRRDREDTSEGRGGGLLVYAKQGLKILSGDNSIDFMQYCKFSVYDITCYLVYRPPNSSAENMTKLANLIKSAEKNAIFIGDLNLPGVNWSTGMSKNSEKPVVEATEEMFMEQLVEFSTHTKGNILDLVLTNVPERIIDIRDEGRLGKSDHVMMAVEISIQNEPGAETGTRPDWAKADWDQMKRQIASWNWREELRGCDAETAWLALREKVNQVVNKFVPVPTKRNANRPPWLNQEILREVRKKKRLWKRDKNKPNKDEYKEQEKKVRNLIRKAKKKFERRLADGGVQNKRPFYAYGT
jgi:Endonuclease-reverse transcriptase